MPDLTPEAIAIATLALLGLVQTLRLARSRSRAARRLAANREQGARGERVAERVLEREGFEIVARQPCARVTYVTDGEPRSFDVRADLLVARDGVQCIAEVKTGDQATELSSRATRRQLLEYAHAFAVDTVLLVDAARGTVSRVHVPDRAIARGASRRLSFFATGVVVGVVLVVGAMVVVHDDLAPRVRALRDVYAPAARVAR